MIYGIWGYCFEINVLGSNHWQWQKLQGQKVNIFKIGFDSEILQISLMEKQDVFEFLAFRWLIYKYFVILASETPLPMNLQNLMKTFD